MWSTARDIAPGDLIIIWQTRELVQPLLITPGKDLNSRFGHYRHNDLIGIPYGSKVGSRNGKGFIHVLRPTPELWTMALPHRTQILYLADIAFITSWLDIRRGSRVIEAGTGSGSFSHSVARTIGTSGHLYSYEFHEARADRAREEFVRHGMEDIVTLTHRNVCKDGFTVENLVDSVFLDLPAPWDAIEHAKKALRKDCPTRICCFSPCMEQVLRTVSALNEAGFTDITMYETLLRPHEVQQLPPPRPLSQVVDKLKRMECYREEKRQRQITGAGKRKREDGEVTAIMKGLERDMGTGEGEGTGMEGGADKRARVEMASTAPALVGNEEREREEEGSRGETLPAPPPEDGTAAADAGVAGPSQVQVPPKLNCSKVSPDVRGHTSYLTFARLVPFPPPNPSIQGEGRLAPAPAPSHAS
ncbi:tRNA methyltransferase complex subunit Cpd1 [Butyriboletus roseoflavus]|nr:tRNA methyltransferase complex subunit Cpd1 [Butyriboletus roseoflavus]